MWNSSTESRTNQLIHKASELMARRKAGKGKTAKRLSRKVSGKIARKQTKLPRKKHPRRASGKPKHSKVKKLLAWLAGRRK